jgi:hypothetical protein
VQSVEGIVDLVAACRGLLTEQRHRLAQSADQRLRELLTLHAGRTAYGRYRRRRADLTVAFGTSSPLLFTDAEPGDASYIEYIG